MAVYLKPPVWQTARLFTAGEMWIKMNGLRSRRGTEKKIMEKICGGQFYTNLPTTVILKTDRGVI